MTTKKKTKEDTKTNPKPVLTRTADLLTGRIASVMHGLAALGVIAAASMGDLDKESLTLMLELVGGWGIILYGVQAITKRN